MRGLIYVFTGEGKGKTSAAIGIAFRASGHGQKVAFFQFMKENAPKKGEYASLSADPNITIQRFGPSLLKKRNVSDETLARDAIDKGVNFIDDFIKNNEVDVVVLDELNVAVHKGLLDIQKALKLLEYKNNNVDIIITGRNAPQEIIDKADMVTELKKVKHPYDAGKKAKKGLDF